MNFTFRAVNPPTEDYEVSLFNADRIVIEKVKNEPRVRTDLWVTGAQWFAAVTLVVVLTFAMPLAFRLFANQGPSVLGAESTLTVELERLRRYEEGRGSTAATIIEPECRLSINSGFHPVNDAALDGPFRLNLDIENLGSAPCFVENDSLWSKPVEIAPRTTDINRTISFKKPAKKTFPLGIGLQKISKTVHPLTAMVAAQI